MCLDPEAVRGARVVPQVFPRISRFAYHVTTTVEFEETLAQLFGATADGTSIDDLLAGMDGGPIEDGANDDSLESAAADNELVKFVNKVIVDAYNQKVSDIHIEPMPGKFKTGIRFRIDGSLVPYVEVPAHFRQAMVTRLKIMCDLDISERRKPQDGKIKFKKYGPIDIELRVATIPSAGGVEDVVMRILAAGEPIPLEKLGLTPHNKERVVKTIEKPYGLFYVCGPTGSGKTTTLHSILKHLNTPDTKIWTAEDPVEITQRVCAKFKSTAKLASTLPWLCALFCVQTQTSSWWASRATKKRWRWVWRRRLRGTWFFLPCTPTPHPSPLRVYWTWVWTPLTLQTRCWEFWRSAWLKNCATAKKPMCPMQTNSDCFWPNTQMSFATPGHGS
jgi:hypothetical protein